MRPTNWKSLTYQEKVKYRCQHPLPNMHLYADKLKVKELVKGQCAVAQLIHYTEDLKDPIFDTVIKSYPSFVMKANHGCDFNEIVINGKLVGSGRVVTGKYLRQQADKWLKNKFGIETNEPHYLKIKPYIFFEEYLGDTIEYRIICFYGKPKLIIKSERVGDIYHPIFTQTVYKTNWTYLDVGYTPSITRRLPRPKPPYLDQLLKTASLLTRDFDHVRIDLMVVAPKDTIYLGEFTFTPRAGGHQLPELGENLSQYWK